MRTVCGVLTATHGQLKPRLHVDSRIAVTDLTYYLYVYSACVNENQVYYVSFLSGLSTLIARPYKRKERGKSNAYQCPGPRNEASIGCMAPLGEAFYSVYNKHND